MRRLLKMTLFV